jgi:hypothetical protein
MLHIKQNGYPGLRCEPRGRDIVERRHCGGVSCTVNSGSTLYRVRFHGNVLALVSSMEGVSRERRFSLVDEVAGAGREVVPGDGVARFGSRTRGHRRAKLRCFVQLVERIRLSWKLATFAIGYVLELLLLQGAIERVGNAMPSDFRVQCSNIIWTERELNVRECARVAEIPAGMDPPSKTKWSIVFRACYETRCGIASRGVSEIKFNDDNNRRNCSLPGNIRAMGKNFSCGHREISMRELSLS